MDQFQKKGAMSPVRVSKDKKDIPLDMVVSFLNHDSYWAKNRSLETIQRSIENSLCYTAFLGEEPVGFARIVTDRAVFAYLCDVFILKSHQGKGFGKQLIQFIIDDPELKGLPLYLLTLDGHGFYRHLGFGADEDLLKRVMRKKPW